MALTIDGQSRVARLTLGALAELEDALAEKSLIALVERFESNAFSSQDVLSLLAAGLSAAGNDVTVDALKHAHIAGGPMAAAKAAAELLARAFVVPE